MRSSAGWIIVLLGGACAGAACADDDLSEWARAAPDAQPGAGSNGAPRITRTDTPIEPQHRLPGYRNELTELSYRWWVSRGRADVGVGLGTVVNVARPTGNSAGSTGEGASMVTASGTVLTLGMRYRTSERSALFADAAGVQGLGSDGGEVVVGKVGVEFKAARSRWNIAYGGLGLHLADDMHMTLRVRKRGLGVTMRYSF